MAAEIEGVLRDDLRNLVTASKVLVVGAGGIGCEVLKNLVMSGFKDIEIVSAPLRASFNLLSQQKYFFLF